LRIAENSGDDGDFEIVVVFCSAAFISLFSSLSRVSSHLASLLRYAGLTPAKNSMGR
jgi:hypothetical protein